MIVLTNRRDAADHHVIVDQSVVADGDIGTYDGKVTDADVLAELGSWINHGGLSDLGAHGVSVSWS